MVKAFDKWLLPYLRRNRKEGSVSPAHILISVCDHFEPFHDSDKPGAMSRVAVWHENFLELTKEFFDSDGEPPKHTFFYPIEQYDREILSAISAICRDTRSEGGVHLHHANDDSRSLEEALTIGSERLKEHGLIGADGRYPFIHGDWALDNSHPEGRHCGVSGELAILRKTGCYADFTLPSAPSPTQTRTINSIYYAESSPNPKSHDYGISVNRGTAELRDDFEKLLIVQGPLGLNWGWRKHGIFPSVENGDLTGANPPSQSRLALWQRIAPRLQCRPDVAFVKLHTHGAVERNSTALLGKPMRHFHRMLAESGISYHYVTAREMVNIIHAFEDGETGPPGMYRDYRFGPPQQR